MQRNPRLCVPAIRPCLVAILTLLAVCQPLLIPLLTQSSPHPCAVPVIKHATLDCNPLPTGAAALSVAFCSPASGGQLSVVPISDAIEQGVVGGPHSRGVDKEVDDLTVATLSRHFSCPFVTNDRFGWAGAAQPDLRRWLQENQSLRIGFSIIGGQFLPAKAHPNESPEVSLPSPPPPEPPLAERAPVSGPVPGPAPLGMAFLPNGFATPLPPPPPPGAGGDADDEALSQEEIDRAEEELTAVGIEALVQDGTPLAIFYRLFVPIPPSPGTAAATVAAAAVAAAALRRLELPAELACNGTLQDLLNAVMEAVVEAEDLDRADVWELTMFGLEGAPLCDADAPLWRVLCGARKARCSPPLQASARSQRAAAPLVALHYSHLRSPLVPSSAGRRSRHRSQHISRITASARRRSKGL